MSEVIKQLNDAEKARLAAQTQAVAQAPASKVDIQSGKQFVFVAHFDGTNNDKDNLALSGNPLPTNVAELWAQMKPLERASENFRTGYYKGVGADGGLSGKFSAAFDPTSEMQAAALKAFNEFEDTASAWLRAHPEANPAESLQVMATGFSRGGGTAAVFSQLLYERGLTDPKTGKELVPPGRLGLAGAMIYDPVTTGYDGNSAFSPTSRNITVVRAENEYRSPFKGVDHADHPGVTTVGVTGNHCNIGGGHDRGIAARVLGASTAWFRSGGLPVQDVAPDKRPDGSATVYHERKLPYSDDVAQGSRHPVARTLFPRASQVAGAAANAADYPITHEPRDGLHAPRALDTHAAREEARMANGWRRFEGAQGTVWRKDYAVKGQTFTAMVVERDLPGKANDRVDSYLMRRDGNGEVVWKKTHQSADSGPAMRQALDAELGATRARSGTQAAPSRTERGAGADASSPAAQPTHPLTAEQAALAQRFKEQLGHRLAQQGLSEREIDTLAAAAVRSQEQNAGQGPVLAFHLKKDGSTVLLQQVHPPPKEFLVAQALAQGEPTQGQATRSTARQPNPTAAHTPASETHREGDTRQAEAALPAARARA